MNTDRVIPLSGIHNFRDYGGYSVKGGGRVKTGLLFRSGEHGKATDEDLDRVDALNLRHVIDLRGNSERRANPCRRGNNFNAEVLFFDGETAGLAPHVEAAREAFNVESAHAAMERLYAQLPTRDKLNWILKRYFAALAKGEGPSVVHCLAGKDRTGMAVDLLHHVLGVHPDDAMEDYLLTNSAGNMDARVAAGATAVRAKYGDIDEATIRVLMGVDARYLIAAREAVIAEFGSIDAFLEQVLGVDDAMRGALRAHLTE
ncbi:tyrosine-protein phosphatase [Pontixanthobacter aquaemixtae]|uniref:Protein-tyrosine-phosphatase n=1 Tax=Pontixanthobacter aquaemixtae TaxID=1958940 RepID=A0A844ZT70_9SPHN|nr:tyrosine-protein phosphatase [Pontixanthobacter aquaemixtae]MXO90007.1 protein-tyrosine-phosphatase [Pontixanthobacter aquaemixtae]